MAVKCGNHGRNAEVYHEDRAEVRACFAGQLVAVGAEAQAVAAVIEASPGSEVVHVIEASEIEEAVVPEPPIAATPPVVLPPAGRKATPGQIQYIKDLARKLGGDPEAIEAFPYADLPFETASQTIDEMNVRLREQRTRVDAPVDASAEHLAKGTVHVIDGVYFRVHVGQQSGRPYAVRATVVRPAVWRDGRIVQTGVVDWKRAAGAINRLTPETIATAEEAAAFGRLAGRCCFCSFPIDTPESTLVGYGPVCATKYGLPWGATLSEGAAQEVPDAE